MKEEMLVICAAQMQQMQFRLAGIDFGEADRNDLRNQLCAMANVLHSKSLRGLNNDQRNQKKLFYEDLMRWMHFLIMSRITSVPEEMNYVIRNLLRIWLGEGLDNLALVFVEGDFSVARFNKNVVGASVFEAATGVRFTKDPIFIRIPHFCRDDMLFNIALFHELGHIVDVQLNLFYDVKENIKNVVKGDMDKRIIREFFPILNATHSYDEGILTSYIKEYIADLFAVQYVGNYIVEYLDYQGNQTRHHDSKTHPHLEKRRQMVTDFINCMHSRTHSTSNFLLKYIMDSFSGSGKGDLALRWKSIAGNDLLNGNLVALADIDDLFSVFKHAWDVVYGGVNSVENARGIPLNTMSHYDFYNSFNVCIKESISAFKANNL